MDTWEGLSGMRKISQCIGWKKIMYGSYNLIVFLLTFVIYPPCELYTFTAVYNDLRDLMEHLGVTILQLLTLYKVVVIRRSRNKIDLMIWDLHGSRFQYEDCDDFQPGEYIMKWKRFYEIFVRICSVGGLAVPICRQIVALYVLFKSADIVESKATGCFEVLPFYSKFPFKTDSMPRCLLAFLIQNATMIFATLQILFTDLLTFGMVALVSLQLITLGGAFATILPRCISRLKAPYDNITVQNEISREIRHLTVNLQDLISYVEFLESMLSFAFLLQLLSTLYVVVTCLYVLDTSDFTDPVFFQQGVFLAVNVIEVSFCCFIAHQVTDSFSSVSDGIYNSDWIQFCEADKKTLLVSLIRLERPLHLTAYNFTPLTLNTFVQVLKSSYSYYTVLGSTNQ